MENRVDRKIVLGIGILISFALLILSITFFFNFQHEEREEGHLTAEMIEDMSKDDIVKYMEIRKDSQPIIQGFYFLPFAAFIGVLVGTIIFYIMSDKVIKQERSLEKNTKIILNFLTGQERKVVETLLEHEGKVPQYELSHLPNLNKLRTHRILLNLEQKGIIHKEKLGKINKIVLNKDLFEVLR